MCTSPHAVLNDFRAGALAAALCLVWAGVAAADQTSDKQTQTPNTAGAANGNGPTAPDVMSRDASGHAVVRATRLAEPLQLDGRLDEAVFQTVPPLSDFIQQVPDEGKPATEKTEVWVMYDANNIYLAAKCWDSAPESEWIANDYRRDSFQMKQNDTFGLSFDTFNDHRNGFVFYTNPLGARVDYAVVDETTNFDWNPVWDARPGRFEGGWTVEIAIPFKSLRYQKGEGQRWGMQLRRVIRRKNEWAYLARVPRWAEGPNGLTRVQYAATLVGLELPGDTTNIEVKPYVVARTDSDYLRTPAIRNDPDGDFGVDAKYGITPNMTADFTYNTDFAQVEVDEQQVNLTRFSIQFPEKRDFFLEGKGLFDFARGGGGTPTSIVPTVFFSRRIGLENNRVVPVLFGSRLTGKAGRLGIGALNIQTREDEAARAESTNFTVIRVKSDVLRRSSVGAIFTNRTPLAPSPRLGEQRPEGSNQAYGADANFAFFDSWYVSGYYAKNNTPGQDEDSASYQAKSNYNADRYGLILDYLVVGQNFNPEVGFVQRRDFQADVRLGTIQPQTRINRLGAEVHVRRRRGLHRQRERAARNAASVRAVRVGVREQRHPHHRAAQHLRAPRGAVRGLQGRDHSARELRFQRPGRDVPGRCAASCERAAVAARRRVLRRDDHVLYDLERARRRHAPFVVRAGRRDYARRAAIRIVHGKPVPAAHRLRLQRAHVRQRVSPVQPGRPAIQLEPAIQVGVPAGQRALRRLHRRAGHPSGPSRPAEPRFCGKSQSAVQVLNMNRPQNIHRLLLFAALLALVAATVLVVTLQWRAERRQEAQTGQIFDQLCWQTAMLVRQRLRDSFGAAVSETLEGIGHPELHAYDLPRIAEYFKSGTHLYVNRYFIWSRRMKPLPAQEVLFYRPPAEKPTTRCGPKRPSRPRTGRRSGGSTSPISAASSGRARSNLPRSDARSRSSTSSSKAGRCSS